MTENKKLENLLLEFASDEPRLARAIGNLTRRLPIDLLRATLCEPRAKDMNLESRIRHLDPLDGVDQQIIPLLSQRSIFAENASAKVRQASKLLRLKNARNNAAVMSELGQNLAMFSGWGIETICFKGASLLESLYGDNSLRQVGDMDILVREAEFVPALEKLADAGWVHFSWGKPIRHAEPRFNHAIDLKHPELSIQIDLHCHVNHMVCWQGSDEPYWHRSRQGQIAGVTTHFLSAEDNLHQLVCHGLMQNHDLPVRSLMDAVLLLMKTNNFCWPALLENTARCSTAPQLLLGLVFIESIKPGLVPESVLDALADMQVDPRFIRNWSYELDHHSTRIERLEARYLKYALVAIMEPDQRRKDLLFSFLRSWSLDASVSGLLYRLGRWLPAILKGRASR